MAKKKVVEEKDRLVDTPPFCVRFRIGDLRLVKRVARKELATTHEIGELHPSTWVRQVVLERTTKVLNGDKVSPLTYMGTTADGEGEQICLRFKPSDYVRVRSAAMKEANSLPSPWVRAIVMERAGIKVSLKNGKLRAYTE